MVLLVAAILVTMAAAVGAFQLGGRVGCTDDDVTERTTTTIALTDDVTEGQVDRIKDDLSDIGVDVEPFTGATPAALHVIGEPLDARLVERNVNGMPGVDRISMDTTEVVRRGNCD